MASVFPTATDAFPTGHVDNVGELIHASSVNDIADASNKIEAYLRGGGGWYDVTMYGIVGNGSTDNSAALTSLLSTVGRNATLVFPMPTSYYRFNSTVTVPRANDYVRILSRGVGRYISRPNSGGAAILRRAFNGPILDIQALGVELDHLCFDADGDTYTGPLVQISALSGIGDQYVSYCGFLNIDTYGIHYTVGGGGQRSKIHGCTFVPKTAGMTAGIHFPDDFGNGVASGDRLVSDCQSMSGTVLIDINNGINTNITGCSGAAGTVLFGTNSQKCSISSSRVTGGPVFQGNQHSISNCTVNGGSVQFGASASDCTFGPNAWPWTGGFTITDLNYPSGRNRVNEPGYMNSSVSISANGATISTANLHTSPVNPNAAYTGIIMQAGQYPRQICNVINEGSGSSSLTFAAPGTSNVAQAAGSNVIIVAGTSKQFIWDPNDSRWHGADSSGGGGGGGIVGTEFLRAASFPSPIAGDQVTTPMVEGGVTLTAIRGYRPDGTGATINVLRNGVALLGSALSIASSATWASVTSGLATLSSGDTIILQVVSASGSPTEVVVELVGTRTS